MDQEIYSIIRLARSVGVGHVTFRQLMQQYNSAQDAVANFNEFVTKYKLQNKVSLSTTAQIDQELGCLNKIGGQLITYKDTRYPNLLKQIYDFPILLSALGNLDFASKACIAIVGSRNASANGYRYGYMLAKQATERGYVVTSGLARGIDTAAHYGAIGHTIACLAGGVDFIYPPENHKLYDELKETGLIISEMPFGTIPKATNFPMRNRIISGISESVIVVEAALNSGSLITARCALEQNRDVYAVPSFPGDPRARGTIKLLKEGAYLIEDFNDYKKDFYIVNRQKAFDSILIEEDKEEDMPLDMHDVDQVILQQINSSPVAIDEIVAITSLSINIVLSTISKFELEGRVCRQNGNKVVLIK